MSIEEKIAEIILSACEHVITMAEDGHNCRQQTMGPMDSTEYAKEILSLFRIEIECPECKGKGYKIITCGFPVSEVDRCPKCKNGKITKPAKSGDVGRIK